MNRAIRMAYTLAMVLVLTTSVIARAEPVAESHSVRSFIHKLIGEWIGDYEQFTDGKKADTKYFHAIIKESGPDTYETVFEYYRLDPKAGAPIKVGESIMTTTMAPDGTATNNVIGHGEVMVDPKTSKPEQHDVSEVLRASPGGMEGAGSGRISISGLAFGLGKNGKVTDYRSAWTMEKDTLKISQDLQVKFRVLLFSKSVTITGKFSGDRGSDIAGLMKRASEKGAASE